MDENRRKFLKLAGLTALGITVGKYARVFAHELPAKVPYVRVSTKKRWAMVVNIKKCAVNDGCTKCSIACHETHNVPQIENKNHEIKWIWKEDYQHVFIDQENHYLSDNLKKAQVPIFCNHCDNPPCVKVCPTQATWKREDGIVMMDWHRCLGCRYCMTACPYGSRSFNWFDPRPHIKQVSNDFPTRTKGVVEKCTFCDERLARGLAPSCVDACSEGCLIFGDLNDPKSNVRQVLKENFSIRRKPGLGTEPEIYYIV
jgi:molybdopterin-containing oxidoreductase family iron-sulfur binding subunit